MALWDHVQSRGVDSGAGTSAALAFLSNNTAGNIIIVAARFGGTAQNPGISDSQGNTYVRQINRDPAYGADTFTVWYALNCAAGANTVTITNASSVTRRWVIHEYSANGETISFDQSNNSEGTNEAPNSGNVTTTAASELLFGACTILNARDVTAGTGYTERQEVSQKISTEDKSVASTGTYAADFTTAGGGGAAGWAAGILTFKSAVDNQIPIRRLFPIPLYS